MSRRGTAVVIGLAFGAFGFIAACADSSSTRPALDSTAGTSVDATDETTSGTTLISSPEGSDTTADGGSAPVSSESIDTGLQPYIDIAVADLAERLSINATDVGVTSATLEEWSDSSLGCPQPDQQYAQVVTDGSLIVLTVAGKTYRYHAGGSRTPFLCEQTGKAPPITGLSTP